MILRAEIWYNKRENSPHGNKKAQQGERWIQGLMMETPDDPRLLVWWFGGWMTGSGGSVEAGPWAGAHWVRSERKRSTGHSGHELGAEESRGHKRRGVRAMRGRESSWRPELSLESSQAHGASRGLAKRDGIYPMTQEIWGLASPNK